MKLKEVHQSSQIQQLSRPAILNLGYGSRSQGVRKKTIRVEFLILGYTKGYNSYLGVSRGVQFLFGGTQRGTISIWGYASTKGLRTPDLDTCVQLHMSSFSQSHPPMFEPFRFDFLQLLYEITDNVFSQIIESFLGSFINRIWLVLSFIYWNNI